VNAFYVHNWAKDNFEIMSSTTNGKCSFLDIHSSKGSESLTDLVTVEILRNVGQSNGGKK